MYLFHPLAPRRIAQLLPQAKLIVLLRDPVDRAYSAYWLQVRNGNETLSFEEAIECEADRIRRERQRIILHDGGCYSLDYWRFSYLMRGIYVDQLKIWQRLYPKEQMLILRSEDYFANPAVTANRVFAFLDLCSWETKDCRMYEHASYPEMAESTRKKLATYFQPHNERLYQLLGRDFGWTK